MASLTYRAAGVDIAAGEALVDAIKPAAAATRRAGVLGGLGGFGALFDLKAVWVIFALFAGGAAFGFVGILLAVPVTATIGVLARFWLRRYLASPLYRDPPPPAAA